MLEEKAQNLLYKLLHMNISRVRQKNERFEQIITDCNNLLLIRKAKLKLDFLTEAI